jgi:hypothetical protein
MTAPTGIRSGVGFRNCVIFALNAAGLPAATATTPYEGVRLSGAKTLTINDVEPRKITHVGDDVIIAIDFLPPVEGMSGELHTGKRNDVVDAVLTGQKAFAAGNIAMFGLGTDKRGYEPQVGLLAYQQANDTDPASVTLGRRVWESRVMPKALLYSRDTGLGDQPTDHIYTVVPAIVGAHLWGPAFTDNIEGHLSAQMFRAESLYKPKLVAWLAEVATTEYLFPVNAQAADTDYIVTKNGVILSTGMTKATNGVTFSPALEAADLICAFYEVAG